MRKPLAVKLIVIAALLGLVAGVFAWRKEAQRDKLSDVAAALAGKSATDCGRAMLPDNGDYGNYQLIGSVDHYAIENFKARKPFFARYDTAQIVAPGTRATPTKYEAVIGTPQGKVSLLSTAHPEDKSSVQQRLVANPRIVKTGTREYLKCR